MGRIAQAADIGAQDVVVEIGPGTGNLTEYLLESARMVIAVELDQRLVQYLHRKWPGVQNLVVLQQDALKCDWDNLASLSLAPDAKFKLAANLPYYIATPLLLRLADVRHLFLSLVVMLQQEVGERILACSGSKIYGLLSVAMQYYFTGERLFNVPAAAFRPRPKVNSMALRLIPRPSPPVKVMDEKLFFRLLGAAFGYRRKFLTNALALGLQIPARRTIMALEGLGLAGKIRAEQLTLADFALLSNLLAPDNQL